MKHRHLAALILTLSTSASSLAFASPNQVYINLATGLPLNSFNTDIDFNTNNSDTVIVNAAGGNGNTGQITSNSAVSTLTNVQENGSNNYISIDNTGASNSSVQVYQGNSAQQKIINGQDVNVASDNYDNSVTSGSNQNVLVVQKGNENVSFTNVTGSGNTVSNIQQMKNIAAADIVDSKGNHYRGGNDSTIAIAQVNTPRTIDSTNNQVAVNQYEGAVSHINIQGSSNAVNVNQANDEFTTERTYNPTNLMNIVGSGNTDTVNQNAAGAGVNLVQNANNSSINVTQNLGGNQANITQVGSNESAIIKQTSDNIVIATVSDASSSYNTLNITQTGGAPGTENSVFAPQSGNQNHLTATQTGDSNIITGVVTGTSLTGQSGTNNNISIDQNGESNTATYVQAAGNANTSTIHQAGGQQFSSTNQQGSNNTAYISQTAGSGNSASITQTGNNNRAGTAQDWYPGGNYGTLPTTGTVTKITQIGNGNGSFNLQNGANESFIATQTGNGNYISSGAGADYNAFGTTPWLYRNDGYGAPQWGNGNKATLTQTGDNNSIIFDPFGSNNTQVVTQKGSTNFGYVTIYGDNNTQNITQTGGGNIEWAAIGFPQTPNYNNSITYSQISPDGTPGGQGNVIGGKQFTYDAAGIMGNGNIVNISQNGLGNYVGYNVFGDSNRLSIAQNGNGNNVSAIVNGNDTLNYTQQGNGLHLSYIINMAPNQSATIVQTHN